MVRNTDKTWGGKCRLQEEQWQENQPEELVGFNSERYGIWSVNSISSLLVRDIFSLLMSRFHGEELPNSVHPSPHFPTPLLCGREAHGRWIWGRNRTCTVQTHCSQLSSQEHALSAPTGGWLGQKTCLIQGWSIRKTICHGSNISNKADISMPCSLTSILSQLVSVVEEELVHLLAFLKLPYTCGRQNNGPQKPPP